MLLGNRKLGIGLLLTVALMVSLGAYIYWGNLGPKNTALAEVNQELALTQPAFPQEAAIMATFLTQEAGMSIWLNATAYAPLNLIAAQNAMINIENATSDYVIGSLKWTGIPSSDDYPHCFVHKSGWIIVYYLKVNSANPGTTGYIGKIIDWQYYINNQLTDNKLHKGMETVCSALGVPGLPNAKYYHFQYPTATNLMIAIKSVNGGTATFNIKIPGELTVYERSWSHYMDAGTSTYKIDTTIIHSLNWGPGTYYGGPEITVTVLSPDLFHTVSIDGQYTGSNWYRACLLILYS